MTKKEKSLILVGAGFYQKVIVLKAQEKGFFVIAIDIDKNAPGAVSADYHIHSSAHDAENSYKLVKDILDKVPKITAVISGGTRKCIYVTAFLAQKLGLPGLDKDLALTLSDRLLQKKMLANKNITTSNFKIISESNDLNKFVEVSQSKVLLKVDDTSGGSGIFFINNLDEVQRVWDTFLNKFPGKQLFAEKFLDGKEIGVTAIVNNEKVIISAVYNRYTDRTSKFGKVLGYSIPANMDAQLLDKIKEKSKTIINLIGIDHGVCSVEYIVENHDDLNVIEVEANYPGSYIGEYLIPQSTGNDFISACIDTAAGVSINTNWNEEKPSLVRLHSQNDVLLCGNNDDIKDVLNEIS